MYPFLEGAYLWIKALHVISVIAWMAGLLYLPRLFVYHVECTPGSEGAERFKVMERRLLRAIMNPAMIATYLFGLALALTPGLVDWSAGWVYLKAAGIVVLTAVHHQLGRWRTAFAEDRNEVSGRTFRIVNEVPAVAMVAIVIAVIVRPF